VDWKTEFLQLGKNELVGLCRQAGYKKAHKSMTPEELIALLEGSISANDPMDPLRDEIMAFIAAHKNEITLSCDGNCYAHNWAKVLQCHNIITKDNT